MPRSRAPYPPDFRQRIVELVGKGRTPEALVEQFEPSAQTIRNWLAQTDRDAGQRPDGLTSDEREELRRLRREKKSLREERETPKNGRGPRRPTRPHESELFSQGVPPRTVEWLWHRESAKKLTWERFGTPHCCPCTPSKVGTRTLLRTVTLTKRCLLLPWQTPGGIRSGEAGHD